MTKKKLTPAEQHRLDRERIDQEISVECDDCGEWQTLDEKDDIIHFKATDMTFCGQCQKETGHTKQGE